MSLVSDRARRTPDALALADERVQVNWAAFDMMVNRAVNAILDLGLGPDDRIAVFAANAAETALAYVACLQAGVSSVPVNYHFTAEEVAYILADASAAILLVGPETAETGLAAAALTGARVIGWRCAPRPGLLAWQAWLDAASAAEPPGDLSPRPHLHYTSGTTGRPKGAETPPTLLPKADTAASLFQRLREQVAASGASGPNLAAGPLYHTGPLSSVRQLAGGAGLVLLERFDPEKVLQAIDRYAITSSVMVPTHFQRLLALPPDVRARYDVSSLVSIRHTGAACPHNVKRQMIDWFGPVLIESYGGTEAGATNIITSEEWLRKPGSVGRTQSPFEPLVVTDDGQLAGRNQVGQLYFRDATGRGIIYYNDEDKTRSVHLEPGVFTLGEIGYVDEDGYVFITDRASDMIVSGGVNIYPAETEQVLLTHPEVSDAAVIGAPNADMGEEVKALIIPRRLDQPPSAEQLDRHCRRHLAGYKCPRSYEFRADIGRNAMGKINKRELRRPYWPSQRTIGG